MIRVLRFHPGRAAAAVDPAALPKTPGGGLWCDLTRDDLPVGHGPVHADQAAASTHTSGAAGPSPGHHAARPAIAIEKLAAWLEALHPLTAERLRHPAPTAVASAQEGYVHLRLPLVPHWAATTQAARPYLHRARAMRAHLEHLFLDLVIGPGFVLTVHTNRWESFEQFWQQLLGGEEQAAALDFAVYLLLVRVGRDHRLAVTSLLAATDQLLERLTERRARHLLSAIVHLRRQAADLRAVLAGTVNALGVLSAGASAQAVRTQVQPFYHDQLSEAKALLGAVENARSNLAEAVEAYTSVQSTEMNRVMQIFTVVAVIFMPPTLVASIYGMNFKMPEYHWSFGYAWALGLMGGSVVLLVTWFKARDYLP